MGAESDQISVLEPISVPSAADVVVGQVTRAIELGRFLPGDRLPAEREFAVQLGVSRVTLRTALAELESAGLLRRVQRGSGGGALVISTPSAAVTDAHYRDLREDLDQLHEFRLACESATAELAAERRRVGDLDRLGTEIEMLASARTPGDFRAADNAFHLAIADTAGNRRLRGAVEDARAAMFAPLDAVRFEVVLPSAIKHHRRILEAIGAADRIRSREAMIEHIREAHQELLVVFALVEP